MNLNGQDFKIAQRKELGELFGIETRNKYEIRDEMNTSIGFAAEQGKGFGAMILRQFLGHWRPFKIHLFSENRQIIATADHPFRFIFQELKIFDANGRQVALLKQRFSILYKRFDIVVPGFSKPWEVKSPVWKIWTFPVYYKNKQVATISKKWSGLLKEAFTDADNFQVQVHHPKINAPQKVILLCAGLFIDLIYFEKKARN